MEQRPTIGRVVHFMESGTTWPAIVTHVYPNDKVDLAIFSRYMSFHRLAVAHIDDADEATTRWTWPPRA